MDTMSRQCGSMGSYIAVERARRLDMQYLDREIIDSVAREAGVSTEQVEALEARAARPAISTLQIWCVERESPYCWSSTRPKGSLAKRSSMSFLNSA